MYKVVVATSNPVKLDSVRGGFDLVFGEATSEIVGVKVESGVADQPMSDAETLSGATQRAKNARMASPEADFWVGIEGGVEEVDGSMFCFAWVVVVSEPGIGKGRSAGFDLPGKVVQLIKEGMELGDADDVVFGMSNSKQANGAVGILTKNLITRRTLYEPAVVLALIPWMHEELYFEKN